MLLIGLLHAALLRGQVDAQSLRFGLASSQLFDGQAELPHLRGQRRQGSIRSSGRFTWRFTYWRRLVRACRYRRIVLGGTCGDYRQDRDADETQEFRISHDADTFHTPWCMRGYSSCVRFASRHPCDGRARRPRFAELFTEVDVARG